MKMLIVGILIVSFFMAGIAGAQCQPKQRACVSNNYHYRNPGYRCPPPPRPIRPAWNCYRRPYRPGPYYPYYRRPYRRPCYPRFCIGTGSFSVCWGR